MLVYDHGGSDALPTLVGRGYVSLLSRLFLEDDAVPGDRGPFLRQVELVGHTPDTDEIEARWLSNAPAVLVEFVGATNDSAEARFIDWDGQFHLHIFSAHAAGDHEGRVFADLGPDRDTTDDPGVVAIMDQVTEHLHAQAPYAEAELIRVLETRRLAAGPAWAWWVMETRCRYRHVIDPDRYATPIDRIDLVQQNPEDGDEIQNHEEQLT